MPTLFPGSEADRLAVLTRDAVLETPPAEDFGRITSLAAHLFGKPVARISLVDKTRVWFKLAKPLKPAALVQTLAAEASRGSRQD